MTSTVTAADQGATDRLGFASQRHQSMHERKRSGGDTTIAQHIAGAVVVEHGIDRRCVGGGALATTVGLSAALHLGVHTRGPRTRMIFAFEKNERSALAKRSIR